MKNKKQIFWTILSVFSLASCGGGVSTSSIVDKPSSVETTISRTNPKVSTTLDQKIKISAPFTILNEDGSEITDAKFETTYDNWYDAIYECGQHATTKNKLQVQDANFTQVFIRSKTATWFVFDGEDYVGMAPKAKATDYIEEHPESYGIIGTGGGYGRLGRRDYVKDQEVTDAVLELNAGTYNYMFSKTGVELNENKPGFSYCTADVLLSEAAMKESSKDDWNAYIFINLKCGVNCDLGLIGNKIWDAEINTFSYQWRLVRNCSDQTYHAQGTSTVEKEARFYVYHDKVVTKMQDYDPATGMYSGADDLHFEVFAYSYGWHCEITNLTTGIHYSFDDIHVDAEGNHLSVNPEPMFARDLFAASYCPATRGPLFNAKQGGRFDNLIFTNIAMQRYVDDNLETYRKEGNTTYECYPGSEYYFEGYSQGGDTANYTYSTFSKDGKTKGGFDYKKGNKYISYSIYYDNSTYEDYLY